MILAALLGLAAPLCGHAQEKAVAVTQAAPAPEWLSGNWTFDEEFTLKKHAEAKKEPTLTEAVGSMVTGQLVEKLKGATLRIVNNELTMTTRDGNGKSERFTVLEPPDKNTALLKDTKGEVTGFHREGDRIRMTSTGSVNEPFYFKRTP